MTFGYTIADAADRNVFFDASAFIRDKLQFKPVGEHVEDVDGSLYQDFINGNDTISLESNVEIDYVAIRSTKKLPIKALREWQ